jgi:hypothetical protein
VQVLIDNVAAGNACGQQQLDIQLHHQPLQLNIP